MNYCYKINNTCSCFQEKQNTDYKTCFTQLGGGSSGGDFAGGAIDGAMGFIESNGLFAALGTSLAIGILLRKKK